MRTFVIITSHCNVIRDNTKLEGQVTGIGQSSPGSFEIAEGNDNGYISSEELSHVLQNIGDVLNEEVAEKLISTTDPYDVGHVKYEV